MTVQEFIDLFVKELEIEDTDVTINSKLDSFPEYDSMGVMIIIGLVSENFNITLKANELKKLTTIKSLINKIGEENFE